MNENYLTGYVEAQENGKKSISALLQDLLLRIILFIPSKSLFSLRLCARYKSTFVAGIYLIFILPYIVHTLLLIVGFQERQDQQVAPQSKLATLRHWFGATNPRPQWGQIFSSSKTDLS